MSILQYAQCDYKLKPEVDIVMMPVSVISASIGNILTYEENMLVEDDFAGIDNLNIPFFDNWNTTYNSTYADISDVLIALQVLSPLTYTFNSDFNNNVETIGVMYFETLALNYGVNSITKALAGRFRPFSYDTTTPPEVRYHYDTGYSFYSGHSSTAFASAVFNIFMLNENASPAYKDILIGLNLLNATAIATLRVLAGKHFLSDVVVGAIAGSLISYFVTELHKTEMPIDNSPVQPIRLGFSLQL